MADAVLKVSTAKFYKAPVGTARPTTVVGLKAPEVTWTYLGNTTLDNIISLTSEGGETTTLGSLQNPNLRQSVSPRTESFSIGLLDWTTDSIKLYYGANAVVAADGAIEIPSEPQPTEGAFLVVLEDGENVAGFYAAKSSIFRAEDIAVADTNSLASLPIRVTSLNATGAPSALTIIPPRSTDPVAP
jgi:hypothetical protein